MKSKTELRIGIIGAGPAGTAVLAELYKVFGNRLPQVFLIDGGRRWGRGNVYIDDVETALVNREAKHMSILFDEQHDFLNWLKETAGNHGDDVVDGQFFLRSTFGNYLEHRFLAIERQWASAGAPIRRIDEFTENFEDGAGSVRISLADGKLEVDYLILCTGHGPERPLSNKREEMLYPYPLKEVCAATRGMKRVAIVGTGLTAIDCALAVLRDKQSPQISMCSRSGIIPDSRAYFETDLSLTLPERTGYYGATLQELEERFKAELAVYNVSLVELRRYMAKLRRGVRNLLDEGPARNSHRRIQNLSISIANRDLPTYWHGFSEDDRKAFHEKYYRFCQAITAPMPVSVAKKIKQAIEDGRLEIGKGQIDYVDGIFRRRGGAESECYEAAIDATGRLTSAGQSELENRLIATGGAIAEHYGGIRIDHGSGVIVRLDHAKSRVYGIGYVTRGSLFYSSSLYQATRNVKKVVASIWAVTHGEKPYESRTLEYSTDPQRALRHAQANSAG